MVRAALMELKKELSTAADENKFAVEVLETLRKGSTLYSIILC